MSHKWQNIKFPKYEGYDFGPKTPEEEVIFAEEAARVDREVAEYQGTWRCHYDQAKERLRNWYHWQLDRDGLVHDVDRWVYLHARSIKLLYQRLTRGWDDSACWSLDTHLAKVIAPRLKRFKELNTHAWPGPVEGLPGTGRFDTFEEWHEALDKMIYSFECYAREDRDFWEFSEEERKRIEEGLMLFATYYGCLWD